MSFTKPRCNVQEAYVNVTKGRCTLREAYVSFTKPRCNVQEAYVNITKGRCKLQEAYVNFTNLAILPFTKACRTPPASIYSLWESFLQLAAAFYNL